MKEIPLTQGKVALVSDEDYDRVMAVGSWQAISYKNINRVRWYAKHATHRNGECYSFKMHRFILNAPPGHPIDHKDGDGLNNTRENIRLCTVAQNNMGQHAVRGVSKFKGVCLSTNRKKWLAQIGLNGTRKHLGTFASEIEAALAYDSAARMFYGEFAKTNFP